MKKENTIEPSEVELYLLFNEIRVGRSERTFQGKPVFIKHPSMEEMSKTKVKYQKFLAVAKERGLPTQEHMLGELEKSGFWTKKDERQIFDSQNFIAGMENTKKGLVRIREIEQIQAQIDAERTRLAAKQKERVELLGKTAEEYALNRSNDEIIFHVLFKDFELKEHLLDRSEFEEMGYSEVSEYIGLYNRFMMEFSDEVTQRLVLQDFFQPFFLVLESPLESFGKPMSELTELQIRCLLYGRVFKNILETTEGVTPDVAKDPEALLSFRDKSEAKRKVSEKRAASNTDGSMMFGVTREEALEAGAAVGSKSLNELTRKKGGLSLNDMADLHGID